MVKKKRKRKVLDGTRAHRPRIGHSKRLLVQLTDQEKIEMEKAAAKAGLSLSRFIVERALKAARSILAE